jgi:hypothetical protein
MRREKSKLKTKKGRSQQTQSKSRNLLGITLKTYIQKNLEEIDTFLDTYDQPKLNKEDINHLNISITINEIETAIKFPKKEKSRT